MVRVTTSVDLYNIDVEVEIDDEVLLKALKAQDDVTRFLPPDVRQSAEAVYNHFACLPLHDRPECVRRFAWVLLGRVL